MLLFAIVDVADAAAWHASAAAAAADAAAAAASAAACAASAAALAATAAAADAVAQTAVAALASSLLRLGGLPGRCGMAAESLLSTLEPRAYDTSKFCFSRSAAKCRRNI